MHVDFDKLVDLLSEASGLDTDKVREQFKELISEINEAIGEGEAYELEGFGIFSGIGNNVVFIPSEELETEINYKYAGMEPIVLDEETEESDESIEAEEDDDPFAGLLGDEDEEDEAKEVELTAEETESENIFEEDPLDEDEDEDSDEEGSDDELLTEKEEELIPEDAPDPAHWGIDSYKDDTAENVFSGLLGEEDYENDFEESEETEAAGDEDQHSEETEESVETESTAPVETEESELPVSEEEETDLIKQEEETKPVKKDKDEMIPVITNVSSGGGTKKKEKNKDQKENKKEEKTSETKTKKTIKSSDKQDASPWLLVLFVIVLIVGSAAALGYLGYVNIPGITPPAVTQNRTPAQPEPEPVQTDNQADQQQTAGSITSSEGDIATDQQDETMAEAQAPFEQEAEKSVESGENTSQDNAVITAEGTADGSQNTYGLNGSPTVEGNDGYTLVLYSLSEEQSAREQLRLLSEEGYRALLMQINSAQYGTLWRVSIGQFETITDAAIASEDLVKPYADNYFITKIK